MRFSILGPTTHGPTSGCECVSSPLFHVAMKAAMKVAKPAGNIAQGRKSTCV
jgi:hypothetical protein